MIDWIDFIAPLQHDHGPGTPFYAGEVMSTTPSGDLDWGIYKKMTMEGSYSSKVQIRSTFHNGLPAIRVSGNLVKWHQGHNVFGSNDLRSILLLSLKRVCEIAGITPLLSDYRLWFKGQEIELMRVDVTESHDLETCHRVRAALRALDATAHMKMRGRGSYHGDSLIYGKGSRRWSFTLYAKGPEIDKHPLHPALKDSPLRAYADGLLRSELRMHSMHLKRLGIHTLDRWNDNTASEVHQKYLQQLQIAEATMIDTTNLQGLPGRLKAAYQLWKDGHDLRETYPRPTFYRYRKELLAHGIDISVKQERAYQDIHSNVVPLRVVLVAKPAQVPDWAIGTPLYFDPKVRKIA